MNDAEPAVFLDWDTNFFGVHIGRINGDSLTADHLKAIESWRQANAVRCLYFQADSADRETVRLAEENGFHLVEVRMIYERRLADWNPGSRPHTAPDVRVRRSLPSDLPALQEIAKNSYVDSRYYFDPGFRKEQWQAFYAFWVKKSIAGSADLALTAEIGGEIAGYITGLVDREKNEGIYELTGVKESARRLGVGQELFRSGIDWFVEQGVPYIWVATQGRNIATQRMIQRDGFISRACRLYYHKWF